MNADWAVWKEAIAARTIKQTRDFVEKLGEPFKEIYETVTQIVLEHESSSSL